MNKKTKFHSPKIVLIFGGQRTLMAIIRSGRCAAELTGRNAQSISFACNGKNISSGGYYFRHLDPRIVIEIDDISTLTLEDYDKMCGVKRRYLNMRELAHLRTRSKRVRGKRVENKSINHHNDGNESSVKGSKEEVI